MPTQYPEIGLMGCSGDAGQAMLDQLGFPIRFWDIKVADMASLSVKLPAVDYPHYIIALTLELNKIGKQVQEPFSIRVSRKLVGNQIKTLPEIIIRDVKLFTDQMASKLKVEFDGIQVIEGPLEGLKKQLSMVCVNLTPPKWKQ